MALVLDSISKTYQGPSGPVRALHGASLSVGEGEFVVVQGKSGSGKSTLLLIAGGLLAPDAGTVLVAGENPYALRPEARAKLRGARIGFVFQQFHLVPYLSVLQNVLAPSLAADIPHARQRAEQLIERFGMAHRRGHLPGALSTGERQRTALARALLAEPKLILADEPTGNLDRENADLVLDYLAEVAAAGTAVLMVTHDAQAAARSARCHRLEDGALCELAAVNS